MKIIIFTALCCLALSSCQPGGAESAELPQGFNSESMINLEQDLEQLLNKTDVAGLVEVSADKIKVYDENFDDSASVHMLLYSWKDGGSFDIETAGGTAALESYASVGIGNIKRMSEADFERKYRQKTTESVKAEIQAITSDESVNPDVAIWEAKEIAKTAKSQSFEKLDKVGHAAYWETPVNVLHVYAANVAFSITVNLGQDPEVNKEKAIALAAIVFQKLKS